MNDFADYVIRVTKTGHDFTFRQIAILMICSREDDPEKRQVRELAGALGTARAIITRASDRLVEASLASRSELPGDRRTCVISVTPAGRKFIAHILGELGTVKRSKLKDPLAA